MHGRSGGCGSLGKTGCALRPVSGTAAKATPLYSWDGRLTPILTAVAFAAPPLSAGFPASIDERAVRSALSPPEPPPPRPRIS